MKSLFIVTAIIAASFITTKGYSQLVVSARAGFGHVRVGFPVVAPAPVYVPAPVAYDDFPGYAYYDYPAWNGHFRDRVYFEHFRTFFLRSHPNYRSYYRGRRW